MCRRYGSPHRQSDRRRRSLLCALALLTKLTGHRAIRRHQPHRSRASQEPQQVCSVSAACEYGVCRVPSAESRSIEYVTPPSVTGPPHCKPARSAHNTVLSVPTARPRRVTPQRRTTASHHERLVPGPGRPPTPVPALEPSSLACSSVKAAGFRGARRVRRVRVREAAEARRGSHEGLRRGGGGVKEIKQLRLLEAVLVRHAARVELALELLGAHARSPFGHGRAAPAQLLPQRDRV